MELFLLFSLALTFVAFLSIALAEPPAPLHTGVDTDLQLSFAFPVSNAHNEQGTGIPGSALDNERVPSASIVAAEELQAMY